MLEITFREGDLSKQKSKSASASGARCHHNLMAATAMAVLTKPEPSRFDGTALTALVEIR